MSIKHCTSKSYHFYIFFFGGGELTLLYKWVGGGVVVDVLNLEYILILVEFLDKRISNTVFVIPLH